LIKEVEALHPTKDRINSSNGERDKAIFEENCIKLFAPGRKFASSRQLTQVAKLFLDAWAVNGTSQGKKIACHYHKGVHRKTVSRYESSGVPRACGITLKNQYQCPFKIRFTFKLMKNHSMKPLSFYHV
jgi:hypothetical protein